MAVLGPERWASLRNSGENGECMCMWTWPKGGWLELTSRVLRWGCGGRPICKVDVCACIIERREVQRGQVEQMVSWVNSKSIKKKKKKLTTYMYVLKGTLRLEERGYYRKESWVLLSGHGMANTRGMRFAAGRSQMEMSVNVWSKTWLRKSLSTLSAYPWRVRFEMARTKV